MAQQGRFTGHIGTRDHHHLLLLGVEVNIVGHIALAQGHLRLDNRMASLQYVDHVALVHFRAHIEVILRHLGEAQEAIDVRQEVGIDLYLWDKLLHGDNQF